MAPGGKGKGTGKGMAGMASLTKTPVQNAKTLRENFKEIQNSPDGADPMPLTVPKCVECAHCGWPVYARESRVATRKTFEKAGIHREDAPKTGKKGAAGAAGAGGAEGEGEGGLNLGDDEGDDDDEKSVESVGTVEALEGQVVEMTERILELESFNNALESENATLQLSVDELEEGLAAAEEKIELLEESEMRWREKNSVLRVLNDELRLYINRIGQRVGDLETDMVSKLLEIIWRKEETARKERRRALMLTRLEKKMAMMEGEGALKASFKLWEETVGHEIQRRRLQEAEAHQRRAVSELSVQLSQERLHVLSLEAIAARLRNNLKAAAQRMLLRSMSSTQKPWNAAHALTAWCGATPAMKFENRCEVVEAELIQLSTKLAEEEAITLQLTTDLERTTSDLKMVTAERDSLQDTNALIMAELVALGGDQSANAAAIAAKAAAKAKAERDRVTAEVWEEANRQMAAMNKVFEAQKSTLEDEIGSLEAQLEAIKRAASKANSKNDDETRVVPKGQGILCCGCLKQIVTRGVKQLPPMSMPRARSPRKGKDDEKLEKVFFAKELQGMPDAGDMMHSEMWKSRKNPMAGIRYSDISPEIPVLTYNKSTASSLSKLVPLAVVKAQEKAKSALSFKPITFR